MNSKFNKNIQRTLLKVSTALVTALFIQGCSAVSSTISTNASVCAVWKPVSWSKKDTDQTITEIKVNNARREAWCHDAK